MNNFKSWALVGTACLSLPAFAEDAVEVAEAAKKEKPYTIEAEFGYLGTNGNSDTQNLNFIIDGKYTYAKWLHNLILQTYSSETDGERTAEKYLGRWKSDYNFNESHYVFGILLHEKDRFSGYEYESSINLGYGYKIFDNKRFFWDVEGGAGYRSSKISKYAIENPNGTEDEYLVRPATTFKWHFTEQATFGQFLSAEIGQDKTVSRSITTLQTSIVENFALKLTYGVKHTDKVPVGFEKTETESAVTLVVNY